MCTLILKHFTHSDKHKYYKCIHQYQHGIQKSKSTVMTISQKSTSTVMTVRKVQNNTINASTFSFYRFIQSLTVAHQQLLALLFGTWFRIMSYSEINFMSVEALSRSVAGSMFHTCAEDPAKVEKASRILQLLIDNFGVAAMFGRENIQFFAEATHTGIHIRELIRYQYQYPSDDTIPRELWMPLFVCCCSYPSLAVFPTLFALKKKKIKQSFYLWIWHVKLKAYPISLFEVSNSKSLFYVISHFVGYVFCLNIFNCNFEFELWLEASSFFEGQNMIWLNVVVSFVLFLHVFS